MDRLTNLPEPLRNRIVSLLPLEDAIRLTTLSTKWRNICSSLANFNFHQPTFERKLRRSKRDFKDFVYQTLVNHDGCDIEKFTLSVDLDDLSPVHVDSWVSFAVNRNVKEFNFCVLFGELEKLPSCLFTCKALRVLTLDNLSLNLPNKVELPKLETLKCASVMFFDGNLTNNFLSNCPLVEELFFLGCSFYISNVLRISGSRLKFLTVMGSETPLNVEISATNLRYIKYHGDPPTVGLDTLSSLFSADFQIIPPSSFITATRDVFYRRASEILIGMHNVAKMALGGLYIEFLTRDRSLFECMPTCCYSLEHLEVELYPTENQVHVMLLLLTSYPNLKHLRVSLQAQHTSEMRLNINEHLQSQERRTESSLKNLRSVKIEFFEGSESELDLLQYLLENANVLESMNIICTYQNMEDVMLQVSINEKIESFVKASPSAVIDMDYLV